MNRWISGWILLGLIVPLQGESPFLFREISPQSLELTENGRPVYVYNHGMLLKQGVEERFRRSDYVHPVYTPDGTLVTDDFPPDHYHHRGIWWSWPVVKIDGQTHDLWALSGIKQEFVKWIAREVVEDSARLAVESGWHVGERQVAKETMEIVTHRTASHQQRLDFTIIIEALEGPVQIAGREEKGYGGFGMRFAPRTETKIVTDAGTETADTDLVRHRWAELQGRFGGRKAAARIEIDRSHPDFPNGWTLRHYGYLGVAFPGPAPYTLERGKPLRLRYRVHLRGAEAPPR